MVSKAAALGEARVENARSGESYFSLAQRALMRDKAAIIGLVFLVLVVVVAILAHWISPYDPAATNTANRLAPLLSPGHVLGTDKLGRDVFTRLIHGGRVSLAVGIAPVVVAVFIGGFLGLLAGYFSGRVDTLIMRSMDVLLAFPGILLAVGIAAALGPGINNLIVALLIVRIPTVTRIVRASVMQVRQMDYILAAITLGTSHRRVVSRHVLPNVLAPVMVYATLAFGQTIIMAAGLSFLGLGVQPPTPDWGEMLSGGRDVLFVAPHVSTIPGMLIFMVTLSFNLLGDGLRDALDPRLRQR